MFNHTSNPYTFASAFQRLGMGTRRRGVELYWLAMMDAETQSRYGRRELGDADILRMAHDLALHGTGPDLIKKEIES